MGRPFHANLLGQSAIVRASRPPSAFGGSPGAETKPQDRRVGGRSRCPCRLHPRTPDLPRPAPEERRSDLTGSEGSGPPPASGPFPLRLPWARHTSDNEPGRTQNIRSHLASRGGRGSPVGLRDRSGGSGGGTRQRVVVGTGSDGPGRDSVRTSPPATGTPKSPNPPGWSDPRDPRKDPSATRVTLPSRSPPVSQTGSAPGCPPLGVLHDLPQLEHTGTCTPSPTTPGRPHRLVHPGVWGTPGVRLGSV